MHDGSTPFIEADYAREREIISRCINDRIFFATMVLGVTLEPWQAKLLKDLDSGQTRLSIRSGNGVGKTMIIAVIALHYLLFRNDVKIPVTSPSSGQLSDGLIPECHKWLNKLPNFLQDKLHTTENRIVRKDNPANNFISFRTARKESPEALQGIHARFVMCLVDEASGVPDVVFEAAKGTMSTSGAIFIMISNPTRLSGYFYNSHNRLKHRWRTYKVSSFDTSRVDMSFVQEIEETYGEHSDQYAVKVLGEFPSQEDEALIQRPDVVSAFAREIECTGTDIVMGVDPGRGGDLSTLCFRSGNWAWGFAGQGYSDTMRTAAWCKEAYDVQSRKTNKPISAIYVDSIGIGAGVADRLREFGLPAVDVNVAESASMKHKYPRMRDELWYKGKYWLETHNVKLDVPDVQLQDKIVAEFTAPLALFTAQGKDAVESKLQMKKRFIKSPNYADCWVHTFMYESAVASGAYGSHNSSWNKPLEYSPLGVVY